MKNFVALIILLMSTLFTNGQDSWKITLNKTTVLSSSKPDELLNSKKIKSTDWKKNGYLEVSYNETTPSNWRHSIQFADEKGNPVLTKDSTTAAKIPTATLRKLFAGKKQIKIYMVTDPPNPMMMAPSRMIHLATLRLP